jgi:hypothetical protein
METKQFEKPQNKSEFHTPAYMTACSQATAPPPTLPKKIPCDTILTTAEKKNREDGEQFYFQNRTYNSAPAEACVYLYGKTRGNKLLLQTNPVTWQRLATGIVTISSNKCQHNYSI